MLSELGLGPSLGAAARLPHANNRVEHQDEEDDKGLDEGVHAVGGVLKAGQHLHARERTWTRAALRHRMPRRARAQRALAARRVLRRPGGGRSAHGYGSISQRR